VTRERRAAGLGVVAAALTLALAALPYAVARPTAVGTYYAAGPVSPVFVSLLAVIGAITLVSATTGRSDPPLAAGIAVTVGAFAVLLAALWAVPAREVALSMDLRAAFGTDATTWFEHHSLAVVASTLVLAVASGLYTREVL